MPEQFPFPADRYLLVGKVVRSHGLRGAFKAVCLAGTPERFLELSRVALVANDGRMTAELKLDQARLQGRKVILKLDTIDSKDEADLLSGMGILLPRQDLPEHGDTTWEPAELAGRSVCLKTADRPIGTVASSFSNGAQRIMVIENGDREYLVPLIPEFLIDFDAHRIIIDPPPGLIGLNHDLDEELPD